MKQQPLFSQSDWSRIKEGQKQTMLKEISALDKRRILGSSITDLCDYFFKNYKIHIPTLIDDEIVADQKEIKIDI